MGNFSSDFQSSILPTNVGLDGNQYPLVRTTNSINTPHSTIKYNNIIQIVFLRAVSPLDNFTTENNIAIQ